MGITLDKAEEGVSGYYSDGRGTIRFETMRQSIERGAVHPPLERDYYIALRVIDVSTGSAFIILSEDKVPERWLKEAQLAQGREQPVRPEMSRLALEAAQALKRLKLSRDLQPEQELLGQQLAYFGSHPMPQPPSPTR